VASLLQIEQLKDNMDFLRDLNEARMTRDLQNQKVLTYNDCCERLYLTMLCLEFMRQIPISSAFVRAYCQKTKDDNFSRFKISGTDAYNFLYFINGDETALSKLKDKESALALQKKTALPLSDIIDFFKKCSSGNRPSMIQQTFIRMENGMHISNRDYKDIRRNISTLEKLSKARQKALATRLLFATRAKLRNSDIIEKFSETISKYDLESSWVVDTEAPNSKPDITTTAQDLTYYRLVAKPENLILLKHFIEHMRDGKAIPSNMVKAYQPVGQLIDDIITAGPTYINMLKSLQKRAKKQRNKKF